MSGINCQYDLKCFFYISFEQNFSYDSSYILFVPFEGSENENSGIVYVWIGNKAAAEESKLIQEIAEDMFNNPWVSLQVSAHCMDCELQFY